MIGPYAALGRRCRGGLQPRLPQSPRAVGLRPAMSRPAENKSNNFRTIEDKTIRYLVVEQILHHHLAKFLQDGALTLEKVLDLCEAYERSILQSSDGSS